MAWDVDKIAETGLAILNEVGLDGLSTRRLATEMNVKSPALYKHFHNKAELLDYMAAAMLKETFANLDPSVHWSDWLRDMAAASRAAIMKYKDGARLLLSSSPAAPNRARIIPVLVQPLMAAGFDQPAARHALATLASFVEGWMLNEQDQDTRAVMIEEFGSPQESFEESVEFIIMGLAARHSARVSPPTLFPRKIRHPQLTAARGGAESAGKGRRGKNSAVRNAS